MLTTMRWTLPCLLMMLSGLFAPGYAGSPEAMLLRRQSGQRSAYCDEQGRIVPGRLSH